MASTSSPAADPFLALDAALDSALAFHLRHGGDESATQSSVLSGADEAARQLLVTAADAQVALWALSDKLLADRARQVTQ